MKTLNSYANDEAKEPMSPIKLNQSGGLKPLAADHRFMTVTDSYFGKNKVS